MAHQPVSQSRPRRPQSPLYKETKPSLPHHLVPGFQPTAAASVQARHQPQTIVNVHPIFKSHYQPQPQPQPQPQQQPTPFAAIPTFIAAYQPVATLAGEPHLAPPPSVYEPVAVPPKLSSDAPSARQSGHSSQSQQLYQPFPRPASQVGLYDPVPKLPAPLQHERSYAPVAVIPAKPYAPVAVIPADHTTIPETGNNHYAPVVVLPQQTNQRPFQPAQQANPYGPVAHIPNTAAAPYGPKAVVPPSQQQTFSEAAQQQAPMCTFGGAQQQQASQQSAIPSPYLPKSVIPPPQQQQQSTFFAVGPQQAPAYKLASLQQQQQQHEQQEKASLQLQLTQQQQIAAHALQQLQLHARQQQQLQQAMREQMRELREMQALHSAGVTGNGNGMLLSRGGSNTGSDVSARGMGMRSPIVVPSVPVGLHMRPDDPLPLPSVPSRTNLHLLQWESEAMARSHSQQSSPSVHGEEDVGRCPTTPDMHPGAILVDPAVTRPKEELRRVRSKEWEMQGRRAAEVLGQNNGGSVRVVPRTGSSGSLMMVPVGS
ncbi:hypothetical protein HK101_009406, partial [Irineochytrium annulatum]